MTPPLDDGPARRPAPPHRRAAPPHPHRPFARRRLALAAALAAALAGCAADPTPSGPSLAGTWLVATEAGEPGAFGADGVVTLAFDGAASGTATLLGERLESGVSVCGRYLFAVVGDVLLLTSPILGTATYGIDALDDATATLVGDDATLALTRLEGANPVAPCREAAAVRRATLTTPTSWGALSAVGGTLYLNLDTDADEIVGLDVATGTIASVRTYAQTVGGGVHRFVVAAASDDRFVGHCGCGAVTTLVAFDLALGLNLATFDSAVTMSAPTYLRYGDQEGTTLVVGGTESGTTRNRLARLDPDTLALLDESTLLDGEWVVDVALSGGTLYALVRAAGVPTLVEVAADGTAAATYPLPSTFGLNPSGLAASGGTLYLAARDHVDGATQIYAVVLP
jgi:hypothetical protein